MKKILIIGKDSTIAQHLLLKIKYQYRALSKKDFDVTDHATIENFDFSSYDMVMNFAGHSRGTYKGPLNNTWENQLDQIMVNFASHILITKTYCQQRPNGIYMWFSSVLTKSCRPYQYVYAASKLATEYALSAFAKEYKNFNIITKTLDRVITNHLYNTYEGTRTHQECIEEYRKSPYVEINSVVDDILHETGRAI
jgi:short-subunit dehydrogenase